MPVPASIDELSPTASANYPLGTEQVFPNLDNYLRFHAACIAQLRDRIGDEGLPLASVMWWGGARASIQSRFAPMDGQFLSRATYPALWAMVSSGGYPLVTDASWISDPGARASFSVGDGATTFRMPDLNGKQGGLGAVTARGDGSFTDGAPGRMQDSQNKSHSHGASITTDGAHTHAVNDPGHSHSVTLIRELFSRGPNAGHGDEIMEGTNTIGTTSSATGINISSAGVHTHSVAISADGATEARMKAAIGCWLMRVQ